MLRLSRAHGHPPLRLRAVNNALTRTCVRRTLFSKQPLPPPDEWKPLQDDDPNRPLSWRFKLVYTAAMAGALALFAYEVSKPKDKFSGRPTVPDLPMMPNHFVETVVLASTETGPDTRLITLAVPPKLLPPQEPTEIITEKQAKYTQDTVGTPVWSLYAKNPDIQIERPYTPLEGISPVDGRMTFWVKRYRDGEMGRWLCAREFGDKVEVRGPVKTWPWQEDEWDEVIMISGGTGITPFYQLLHHTLFSPPPHPAATSDSSPAKRPHFTLLHASSSPSALPPPVLLNKLLTHARQRPDELTLNLFVDQLDSTTARPSIAFPHPSSSRSIPSDASLSYINVAAPSLVTPPIDAKRDKVAYHPVTVGRIGKDAIERTVEDRLGLGLGWWQRLFGPVVSNSSEAKKREKKILFLVCGPDEMIKDLAGPRGRNLSQGKIGGALGELGYTKEQVYKLWS